MFDINLFQCPEELLCSEKEVFEMLLSLDTNNASGWGGISPKNVKSTAASITLSNIAIYKSISTGKIPKAWKVSSVIPIPKGSNPTSVSNYRLISLLPVISKLLERHIHYLISSHFAIHYQIASQQ